MIRVRTLDLPDDGFDEFVGRHGWVYQSQRFGDVLRQGLGQRILRLVAERDGVPCGALSLAVLRSPLFGNFAESLPVADHSGLLAEDAAVTGALLSEVRAILRAEGLGHAEIRQLHPAPGSESLPARTDKVTLVLRLPERGDVLWKALKPKVRNLCRKGERAGLQWRSGGRELLDEFFPVYARNLRDLGTPCYPRDLFDAWFAGFPDSTRIHLADHPAGHVSAVGMTFRHAARQQIPFAASRRDDRDLAPNMFLYWKILEDSIAGGCSEFDFGRSTRDSGTWRFKKQWGAEERTLVWSYVLAEGGELPSLRKENGRFSMATRVWSRLPVTLTTALSRRLARVLP